MQTLYDMHSKAIAFYHACGCPFYVWPKSDHPKCGDAVAGKYTTVWFTPLMD